MSKRYRKPVTKPGQLRVYYGIAERGDAPDICLAWGGNGANKRDSNLLHMVICGKRLRLAYGEERDKEGPYVFDCSLIDELKTRGYDISTLRFSIQKLPAPPSSLPPKLTE